jgi:hypothetical protein
VKDINPETTNQSPLPPDDFTAGGREMYFTADDGVHGRELWKTDGTVNDCQLKQTALLWRYRTIGIRAAWVAYSTPAKNTNVLGSDHIC